MPSIECGFPDANFPNETPSQTLERIGPTISVIIGSYPAAPSTSASRIERLPALIDTGASISSIDDVLAQQLQLPIVDQWQIAAPGGLTLLNVYLARITIPGLAVTQFGRFTGAHLQVGGQTHRALLGRSLLSGCRLVYDGPTASVILSR